ncbi:MAG: MarR family winged helix-turn-helix transcriptional regulator [Spirochaetales bacterium]|nr:MarR family winged helix-turn-helix transcriptional regulator [Spirochaetales bacterium]
MTDSQKMMIGFAKIQSRINSNDKKARSFGTTKMLHQAEIHFIDAIEPGEGLNASELSEKLGITNGAITQIADKLLKKKLVVKYKKENNKKEVYIRLTPEGEIAFASHRQFHKELNDKIIEYLDGLTSEQIDGLKGLLNVIDLHLPDLSK